MADEERRLVEVAQRGDVASFNELVRLFEGRVYNLCYRMLGDPDSAADAAQDAFLSAFRNLRSFRGGSFRSWMLRIATNTCYDVLRVRKPGRRSHLILMLTTNQTPRRFRSPTRPSRQMISPSAASWRQRSKLV